jgi:hypothetical protein
VWRLAGAPAVDAASRSVLQYRLALRWKPLMTKVTILYWQSIPAMVEARDGRRRHKVQLSDRFQELIDHVAMRQKLAGSEAYLTQWRRGESTAHDGDLQAAAQAVADDLERRFESIRGEAMAPRPAGPQA